MKSYPADAAVYSMKLVLKTVPHAKRLDFQTSVKSIFSENTRKADVFWKHLWGTRHNLIINI